MRLPVTMSCPQIAPAGTPRVITVCEVGPRFIRHSGPEMSPQHWLGACRSAPLDELICSEPVCFSAQPRKIETNGAFTDRADTIFPIVSGEKIATRIAKDRRS